MKFPATIFVISALLTSMSSEVVAESTTHFSNIAPGYSGTSVNTAIFRANSITTYRNTQYACFYDPDGFLTLASRELGSDSWSVKRSQYKGNVADAHNVISMAIDGDGFLHVAFDHHGHPLRYCRSIAPGSLSLGPLENMTGVGEDDVTYPEFHPLADGSLIFLFRSGASGKGNMVMNRYDIVSHSWSRVHDILIDGEGVRNAYWQVCTDSFGTIHLSWVWRETWMVETNHDLCYARSRDGGLSWEQSDGAPYSLPITMQSAEIAWKIPQNSELINQTSMSADPSGNPYIATYWREAADSIPQFRLVTHNGNKWIMEQVGQRSTPFSLKGGGTKMIPISRPRLVADSTAVFYIFRDAERGSKVSIATRNFNNSHSHASSSQWTITDLTSFSVEAWEPTIDNELWHSRHMLHIFVQPTFQGDGERQIATPPTMVSVLQVQ